MKLGSLLFKPKWQDKDAAVRRAAVAADSDPELLTALPEILRSDIDAGVRLAALKRADNYEFWRERSTGDAEDSVRRAARGAYLALYCGGGESPALPRRIAELETLSDEEIERVAKDAKLRELRALAQERIKKANVLADCALNDPDAQLRLQALERINDVAVLERLAERARKTDKSISRRARELIEANRFAGGDARVIAERARALCDQVEALMRAPKLGGESAIDSLDERWKQLGAAIPSELVARFDGAREIYLRACKPVAEPSPVNVAVQITETVATESVQTQPEPAPVIDTPEVLAARGRFDASLAQAAAEAQREREQRQMALRQVEECIPEYTQKIEASDRAGAQKLHAQIEELAKQIGALPAALDRRLGPLRAQYAELDRWLHWSNGRRRLAICNDLAALPEAALHPDAVATRVREAREEWQRLAATEAAHAEPTAIDRRFQALCHRALRPTKIYFAKRDDVRHAHSDAVQALLTRADAIDPEKPDWKTVIALRTELSTALRGLDSVDPRERTSLAKRIKHHIGAIATRMTARDQEVEAAKRRLIERATALSSADQRESARGARDLQREWTALGNGKRSMDQRQWREFRAACDAVFGKLDADRKQREEQTASAHAQAREIVERIETLAASDGNVHEIRPQQRELDQAWEQAGSPDRTLEQRFRRAREAVSLRVKDAERRTRLSRYTLALQKYTHLRALETGAATADATVEYWEATGPLASEFSALDARFAGARDGQQLAGSEDQEQALGLLVRLEYLGGIESPASDRQRRMDFQVQRLSQRMRGGDSADPRAEFGNVLAEWFALDQSVPSALDARFDAAARAVIDALP